MNPRGRGLERRGPGRLLRQQGLEACRLPQRDGEHGPHAVDHVTPKDQRDAQTRLQRQPLGLLALLDPHAIKKRAHQALPDLLRHLPRLPMVHLGIHVRIAGPNRVGQDGQLPRFLFQSHLRDELFLN